MRSKAIKKLLLLCFLILFALEMLYVNIGEDSVLVCNTSENQAFLLEQNSDYADDMRCVPEMFGMGNYHILSQMAQDSLRNHVPLKLLQDCVALGMIHCFTAEEVLMHSVLDRPIDNDTEVTILRYIHNSDGEKDRHTP